MIAATEALEIRRTTAPGGGQAVREVLSWELRRLLSNRSTWALAAGAELFFVVLLLFKHSWQLNLSDRPGAASFTIVGSSAVGMLLEVVFAVLLLFGMCLPFVAADGVARDYRERVHELVMTTPVPGWAYVAGRYLATLLLGLVLCVETLVAALVVNVLLGRTAAGYPAPDVGTLITVWALVVLPAATLLLSLSFALGTLWPRLANVLKLAVLIAWIGIFVFGRGGSLPAWFQQWIPGWDPTSYSLAAAGEDLATQRYAQLAAGATGTAQAAVLTAQDRLPSLQPWVLPHLGLVVLGLACAVVAAIGFRRFRDVLG